MKVYGFTVRKVLKSRVQVREKSYKDAYETLLKLLQAEEESIFENIDKDQQDFEIRFTTIADDFDGEDNIDEIFCEKESRLDDETIERCRKFLTEKCGIKFPIDEDLLS